MSGCDYERQNVAVIDCLSFTGKTGKARAAAAVGHFCGVCILEMTSRLGKMVVGRGAAVLLQRKQLR